MASITQKRLSLHRNLEKQQQENSNLKFQLTNLQHLANIGTASSMIAHEINNLLTPLRSYADLALSNPDDIDLTQKALQKTVRNCAHASKIMESILAMSNDKIQKPDNAQLLSLVEEVFTCLCRDFAKDGIAVEICIPENLTLECVTVQIQHVLMNLILNARQAMLVRGGVLAIKATETTDSINIEISDTGDGIKPADLERIFESFYTTKAKNGSSSEYSGTGLGLAFCKRVIERHRGLISVESKPSQGTKFIITLPKFQSGNS